MYDVFDKLGRHFHALTHHLREKRVQIASFSLPFQPLLHGCACLAGPFGGIPEVHQNLHIDHSGFHRILQILQFLVRLLQTR